MWIGDESGIIQLPGREIKKAFDVECIERTLLCAQRIARRFWANIVG